MPEPMAFGSGIRASAIKRRYRMNAIGFSDKRLLFKRAAVALLALLFLIFLYFLNQVKKPELVNTYGRTFEKATVAEILQDNLQEDGSRVGNQVVLLKMRSGQLKGQLLEATSANGYLFGANCKPGMRVIVLSSVSGDTQVLSVYTADREWAVYLFAAVFFLVLCLVGGKRGIKSAAGLGFTILCIIYLYLPMIYKGASPFWSAILIVIITTIVTIYLISGVTVKGICAVLGTIFGVLVSGIFATLFGWLANINGYNVSNIESLLFIGQVTDVQIGGLLFSGILISSLGAVMDVAMSVASTLCELYENNPQMTRLKLFRSGINVGRDMMGTMSNTLILAFAGNSLSVLVLNYAYALPYAQIVNSYAIGIEIMQGVSGSIGIILTVPLVSMISAALLTARKKEAASV